MKILFWRVLVEPVVPVKEHKSAGGILLPDQVVEDAERLSTVARVVQLGKFAFTARTSLGYNYADEPHKPVVGSFVLIPKYSGRELKLRDGRQLRLIEDYEVLALVEDPTEVVGYV